MNEPQINIDHFYHRPVYHVVGLLTENSEIPAISKDLASAGVDLTAVEILCGEQGARILDEHGRYHGLRGRIVRAFQRLGYDETTLAIYDEALRQGDLLLHVPARPVRRYLRDRLWWCSGGLCREGLQGLLLGLADRGLGHGVEEYDVAGLFVGGDPPVEQC